MMRLRCRGCGVGRQTLVDLNPGLIVQPPRFESTVTTLFFLSLTGSFKASAELPEVNSKDPLLLNMALNLNLRIFLHQVFNSARLMQDCRPASIIWVHVLASPALCPYGAAAVNVTLGHTAQGLSMATRPWRLKAALPGLTKGLHIASNRSIKKLGFYNQKNV